MTSVEICAELTGPCDPRGKQPDPVRERSAGVRFFDQAECFE